VSDWFKVSVILTVKFAVPAVVGVPEMTPAGLKESIAGSNPPERVQVSRINALSRCMAAYQNGLLTLRKLRQNGNQRITVQYVNLDNGSEAVIGNVEMGDSRS